MCNNYYRFGLCIITYQLPDALFQLRLKTFHGLIKNQNIAVEHKPASYKSDLRMPPPQIVKAGAISERLLL